MEEQTKEQLLVRIQELEAQVRSLNNSIIDRKDEYGLRWIDVPEAFEAESENKIPILEEVKELAIKNDDGKPTHILIEGDNYHALQCLNYTHKGKIDVIYIDPPYNTGKEFVYKDKRVLDKFPNGQNIDSNHPLRHSAWLSFMSKRLELAKNLLSDKGVIFISIDDNEVADLRLLCDDIFGEDNFVGTYFWKRTDTPPALSYKVRKKFEYVLCYTKVDIPGRKFAQGLTDGGDAPLLNSGNPIGVLKFPIGCVCFNIEDGVYQPNKSTKIELLTNVVVKDGKNADPFEARGHFKWQQSNLDREISEGTYFVIKSKQFSIRYQKTQATTKVPSNIIDCEVNVGTNEEGAKMIEELGFSGYFEYAKPISLVQYLVKMPFWYEKDITILDFFAGSGTTMHAVMKLNEADGGKRQCILVQQSENEQNICESVTYERNKRVIQGYKNSKGEQVSGLGNSLKYYKTAFVGNNAAATATDEDKVALAHKAGNLIAIAENTLEEIETTDSYQIFQNGNQYTAIYFTGNLEHFAEYAQKIEVLRNSSRLVKVAAYIYCIGNVDVFESEFNKLARITLHAIPQPIIEIYKQLNA